MTLAIRGGRDRIDEDSLRRWYNRLEALVTRHDGAAHLSTARELAVDREWCLAAGWLLDDIHEHQIPLDVLAVEDLLALHLPSSFERETPGRGGRLSGPSTRQYTPPTARSRRETHPGCVLPNRGFCVARSEPGDHRLGTGRRAWPGLVIVSEPGAAYMTPPASEPLIMVRRGRCGGGAAARPIMRM